MYADAALGECQAPARFRLTPTRRVTVMARRRLQAELSQAMAEDAFEIVYHPRVALRSGRPSGAEAVVRWPRRKRAAVPGGAVLPLAEECDAVAEIGAWTLRRACADARGWPDGMVSVAVSPRHLAQGGLVGAVEAALRESKLNPARLSLELPEAALLAAEPDGQAALSMVRDLGAGVVVDDFGSAVGSLAMLRRLPLTGMKLDRSLVRGLPGESQDAAMVGAMVAAARALGMTTVAKGVETEAQRACLAALGCDEAQGYLFVRTDQDA